MAEMTQEINANDGELHDCQQKNPGEAASIEGEVRLAFTTAMDGLAIRTSQVLPLGLECRFVRHY
jgi:hypothetical protein